MRPRANVVKLVVRHPVEAAYRFAGQLEGRRVDAEAQAAAGVYSPDPDWLSALHARLGAPDCAEDEGFRRCWAELEELAGGLNVNSHDGDAALGRALWCAIRHGRARRVVETGVARGVSSRVSLEALDPDCGLWSVDLPLLSADWSAVIASAVPERLHARWTYVRGPSRRMLPRVLAQLGTIDVFLQDSRSTVATAGFEIATAWAALRPGGILIANSVDASLAFARFVEAHRPPFALTAEFERKSGLFGIAQKG